MEICVPAFRSVPEITHTLQLASTAMCKEYRNVVLIDLCHGDLCFYSEHIENV